MIYLKINVNGEEKMLKISGDDIKECIKSGGRYFAGLMLEVYGENVNQAGEQAFSEAIEIGIENTVMALIDANVNDDEIIRVINKHWGINQQEAEDRIVFEKQQLAISELKRYLKMKGYSKNEIWQYVITNEAAVKIRNNPNLLELRRMPDRLIEEIQKMD